MTSVSPENSPRCLAVLTVKNEGAFLLEWLAHHRAVGITDFLVFSNDCEDGTDAMLDQLAAMGWLTHIRNEGPYHERGVQFTALKSAKKQQIVAEADWILPLDIDEFVTVKTGNNRLADLIAALPDATAITLTWRLFGNAGVERFQDTPVTQQFTHCAPDVVTWPWRASMFKTLYRNDGIYRDLGVHRPRRPWPDRLDDSHWFDCEGRVLGDAFKTKRIFSNYGQPNYGLAQLNHYPLGAMESYILKSDRGRAVHADDRLGMDYWVERNFNEARDTSIHAVQDDMMRIRAALLDTPTLGRLHDAAVLWRHDRFETLMTQDPFRALYGRLLMSGATKMLSRQAAQFIVDYARAGADSGRFPLKRVSSQDGTSK